MARFRRRSRRVAFSGPRELPNGYLVRVGSAAHQLSKEEAGALADAANDLHAERLESLEGFLGVEIADAIEAAWAGWEAPSYTLRGPLARSVLEALTDEVVSGTPALGPLRDALRSLD
jgi:hypothetical protein